MSVSIHSSVIDAGDDRAILAVRILPKRADAVARRPFHLALLLDTSGSMNGDRIQAVKDTLHLLINALSEDDVLTLISYNSVGTVIAEAHRMGAGKDVLHTAVDALIADGGTNLEAALITLSGVAKNAAHPPVDAAFLMTDGHVNVGISGTAGLLRIANSAIVAGTPLSTLGYGADHNARLLRDMAVRSRGSYTYADSAELLPAIIGDIMAGLAGEVGRCGTLTLPAGWTCLELGAEEGADTYNVGTLIDEKTQWIVLEGPRDAVPANMEFKYTCGADAHNESCSVSDEISKTDIATQHDRVKVATGFKQVTELLEQGQLDEARALLTALGASLDTSVAKDTTFVIRLRAQVDEMLESIDAMGAPSPVGLPGAGGLHPSPARGNLHGAGGYGLAPMLSRLASNTTALGNQRGFLAGAGGLEATFSSPAQRSASSALTHMFTQDPTP
jgi:hypothetical protein